MNPNPDRGTLNHFANYIDNLMNQAEEAKKTIGLHKGYYPDSREGVGTVEPAATSKANMGLNSRNKLTSKGETVAFREYRAGCH